MQSDGAPQTFIEFNQFAPSSKKYRTCNIQANWVMPCPSGARSSYVISSTCCNSSLVSLSHSCSQPSPISQWATKQRSPSTGACSGRQTRITHLPQKGRQRQAAEGLSEEHVLPARPGDKRRQRNTMFACSTCLSPHQHLVETTLPQLT